MTTTLRFDHFIIAVFDVDAAIANYKGLGFAPFYGGKHASGVTQNALVVFSDGIYLELIAPTNSALLSSAEALSRPGTFLQVFAPGEGLAGFAFVMPDLQAEVAAMRGRGLALKDPAANSRLRPDGTRIAWRAATFADSLLPFFLEDETPRSLRAPNDANTVRQPNGATGVAEAVMVVNNLENSLPRYRAIFGIEPQRSMVSADDTKTAAFTLGATTLTLAEPAGGALHQHLKQRGESLYTLRLRTTDSTRVGVLDMAQAHGARIELVG